MGAPEIGTPIEISITHPVINFKLTLHVDHPLVNHAKSDEREAFQAYLDNAIMIALITLASRSELEYMGPSVLDELSYMPKVIELFQERMKDIGVSAQEDRMRKEMSAAYFQGIPPKP